MNMLLHADSITQPQFNSPNITPLTLNNFVNANIAASKTSFEQINWVTATLACASMLLATIIIIGIIYYSHPKLLFEYVDANAYSILLPYTLLLTVFSVLCCTLYSAKYIVAVICISLMCLIISTPIHKWLISHKFDEADTGAKWQSKATNLSQVVRVLLQCVLLLNVASVTLLLTYMLLPVKYYIVTLHDLAAIAYITTWQTFASTICCACIVCLDIANTYNIDYKHVYIFAFNLIMLFTQIFVWLIKTSQYSTISNIPTYEQDIATCNTKCIDQLKSSQQITDSYFKDTCAKIVQQQSELNKYINRSQTFQMIEPYTRSVVQQLLTQVGQLYSKIENRQQHIVELNNAYDSTSSSIQSLMNSAIASLSDTQIIQMQKEIINSTSWDALIDQYNNFYKMLNATLTYNAQDINSISSNPNTTQNLVYRPAVQSIGLPIDQNINICPGSNTTGTGIQFTHKPIATTTSSSKAYDSGSIIVDIGSTSNSQQMKIYSDKLWMAGFALTYDFSNIGVLPVASCMLTSTTTLLPIQTRLCVTNANNVWLLPQSKLLTIAAKKFGANAQNTTEYVQVVGTADIAIDNHRIYTSGIPIIQALHYQLDQQELNVYCASRDSYNYWNTYSNTAAMNAFNTSDRMGDITYRLFSCAYEVGTKCTFIMQNPYIVAGDFLYFTQQVLSANALINPSTTLMPLLLNPTLAGILIPKYTEVINSPVTSSLNGVYGNYTSSVQINLNNVMTQNTSTVISSKFYAQTYIYDMSLYNALQYGGATSALHRVYIQHTITNNGVQGQLFTPNTTAYEYLDNRINTTYTPNFTSETKERQFITYNIAHSSNGIECTTYIIDLNNSQRIDTERHNSVSELKWMSIRMYNYAASAVNYPVYYDIMNNLPSNSYPFASNVQNILNTSDKIAGSNGITLTSVYDLANLQSIYTGATSFTAVPYTASIPTNSLAITTTYVLPCYRITATYKAGQLTKPIVEYNADIVSSSIWQTL
jgi:hypothetical protein